MSISERRKREVETPTIVSKSRRSRRRPIEPATQHGHPFRVNATKLARRQFLHLAAGAATLPTTTRIATAQTYPARPVRIIVGFPPGGATDIVTRLIAQSLSERLGQQFIVDNRPGANSNIGTEAVVHAPPDGYTLLVVDASPSINATLYDKLNFNFVRDIAPVASIVRAPLVIVVNLSVPAKTIAEFVAYAKASPGKINMASAGIGNISHVSGELFKMMTGVNMLHVPYRGGAPALTDLMGGQVQVYFTGVASAIPYIRAGKLRALAATSATRLQVLPDIPTLGEFVPGYEATGWNGIGAPKNTPAAIVEKLNKEINASLADPRLKARLADLGAEPMSMSPAEFEKFVVEETEKWAKVIRATNIKAE